MDTIKEKRPKRARKPKGPVRLNLGGGNMELPGYANIDRLHGQEAYPLNGVPMADEIRASHLLEHFSHKDTVAVLTDWVEHLQPGGVLKVAVPDFDRIAALHLHGTDGPTEGFIVGGQVDGNDFHKAIFTEPKLRKMLREVGLRDVRRWESDADDCSAYPISLNLQGTKPAEGAKRSLVVAAVMSIPRLMFADNFFCATKALRKYDIPIFKTTGAFWGQSLERGILKMLEEIPDCEAVLTIDYDTVFREEDVVELSRLMCEHPEVDALAPLQSDRSRAQVLLSMPEGEPGLDALDGDLAKTATAHFGFTLLRVSSLLDVPHPWFKGEPNEDGLWEEGRTDADVWFWKKWGEAGKTLYVANRVVVGHAELMIRWPGKDLRPIYQHPNEFWDKGAQPPAGVWT